MSTATEKVDMHELLKARYNTAAWSFCFEVPDGTSHNKRRTIDAIAMGCWKSEGIHLNGFEIKHSRSDWLKELDQPEKQITWMPYLHRFWVVAVKGIVKLEELPAEWGLLENRGNGLKVSKQASLLTPQPIPHTLLAAIMRRILNTSASEQEIQKAYEKGRAVERARVEETVQIRTKQCAQQLESLREDVKDFEAKSGVKITHWYGGDVGEKFKAFRSLEDGKWSQALRVAREFVEAAEKLEQSGVDV